MHPTTRYLLMIVIIAVFTYCAVAFVVWQSNPMDWGWFPRLAAVAAFVGWLVLSDYEGDDEDEDDE